MVSIPDWSRFRRGPPPPSPQTQKRAMTPRERYIRAMEKEAISEASKKGYFLEPDKKKIIEDFGDTRGAEDPRTGLPLQKQPWHVNHIRYSHKHMKILGDIGMFSHITILILDHNYLDNIDSLESCRELIKLDIHSNQISVLPDGIFWSQLQKLRILIAHDNPIARVEVVHSLVTCGRLQILTLYDSPLALKRNYRHHIVNTLWSLKALDNHVVSDEEIIEDAIFKKTRFSTQGKHFEIDLCSGVPKSGASFEEELVSVRVLISKVNKIMAHYCPVLVIQKNIRFWLTYRRYRLYLQSRLWAAITIQRAWRFYKDIPDPVLANEDELDRYLTPIYSAPPPTSRTPTRKLSGYTPATDSLTGYKAGQHNLKVADRSKDTITSANNLKRGGKMKKRGLIIDLQKLQKLSYEREDSLNARAVISKAQKMVPKKLIGKVPGTRSIPPLPAPPGRKPMVHQKTFFGAVVKDRSKSPAGHSQCLPSTLPETDLVYSHSTLPLISSGYKTLDQLVSTETLLRALENSEEISRIPFRLEGQHNEFRAIDRFEENIISKKEFGQDIRDLETKLHDHRDNIPPQTRVKKEANVKDKFLYERLQNTMTLSALTAVQQAYTDRDMDEKNAAKSRYIMDMRERRELSKDRFKAYQEEKKILAINSRQDDKNILRECHETNQKKASKDVDKAVVRREKVRRHRSQREAEYQFAMDFRTQQTSVSKALIRHDRQIQNDAKLQLKMEKVEVMKEMEREQQEIVRKYLHHRQVMRQSENAVTRAALDTRMLQDANDRVIEAKSRIDHLKTRKEQARQYTTLPSTAIDPPPDLELPKTRHSFHLLTDSLRHSRLTPPDDHLPLPYKPITEITMF